MPWANSP